MIGSEWADITPAPGGGWNTALYVPTYAGSGRFRRIEGPLVSTVSGLDGATQWLRSQGWRAVAWKSAAIGYRTELKRL